MILYVNFQLLYRIENNIYKLLNIYKYEELLITIKTNNFGTPSRIYYYFKYLIVKSFTY